MRYLLDTHAALWWWSDQAKLGMAGLAILSDASSDIFVSAASAWEVATKYRSGKLPDIGDPAIHFPRHMETNGFHSLAVTQRHALLGGAFDHDHRDPFDRLIAAQAIAEQMVVVTRDPKIAAFGCAVIW
jgi:PIN domain nuclease of toxin-antitoxin system